MATWLVKWEVVVSFADSEQDAIFEARQHIAQERFEPTSTEILED